MRLHNVIRIDAPPPVVWGVTVDVERWPEWTPTVEAVRRLDSGPFRVGSSAFVRQPGLPDAEWVVTELLHGERFTWETRVRGIRMVASHEVEPCETGTKNTLRLEISGVVTLLMWPLIRRSANRSLGRENAGLKDVCEASTV